MKNLIKYLPLTLIIISCNSDSEIEPLINSKIKFVENFELNSNISNSNGNINDETKLNNRSFEKYFEKWTIDKGSYIISIDKQENIEGKNSLKIKANNTDTFYALPMIQTPTLENIKPNSSYEFSFWLKGKMSDETVCSLYYYFLGGGSNFTIKSIPNEWSEFKFNFTTGKEIDKLNLIFQPTLAKTTTENWNKPLKVDNTIWIDNIQIIEVE